MLNEFVYNINQRLISCEWPVETKETLTERELISVTEKRTPTTKEIINLSTLLTKKSNSNEYTQTRRDYEREAEELRKRKMIEQYF
jgi:hypothetical protein